MKNPLMEKMEMIQNKIQQTEEEVKKKSLWYRIKHKLYLTSESKKQHWLRLQWLTLKELTHLNNEPRTLSHSRMYRRSGMDGVREALLDNLRMGTEKTTDRGVYRSSDSRTQCREGNTRPSEGYHLAFNLPCP